MARATQQIAALSPTDRVRVTLAAHAPYSVAPLVLRAIRHALDHDPFATCSVHLSESAEEVEFIRTGGGPWRELLEELGVWDAAWTAPGVSPVQYLDENGFLTGRVMAIHGVQATAADLGRLVGARDDTGHLSAQQPAHRRGNAADRGVLCLGGAGGRRHRQPGEHTRSESVCRAGDAAPARARGAGGKAARQRDAAGRPCARRSTPNTARSIPARPRACLRSTCRQALTMWKNIWCRGSSLSN